jgi:predicted 2-oxoglutarate/Fe(II)-dependent dioxygenase YbiX
MSIDPVQAEEKLLEVLAAVERPGSFCVHGTVPSPLFRLDVDGVGTLSLPVPPEQAQRLVAAAERAPYGRGDETRVDTEVRKVWQIGAERVHLPDEAWAQTLARIVERATEGLGVSDLPTDAVLYKLLVYDEGSFFVEHRDTEKQDGMYATLIVVLPSLFRGGELVVRHLDQEEVLPLRSQQLSELPFAAFYADCKHELRPVTQGWRVALIYNLVRSRPSREPLSAPDLRPAIEEVTALLSGWGSGWPLKLVMPLEHHYTLEGLAFAGLKNADRGVAWILEQAARRAGCRLHLAMISVTETGSAEGGYDDEDYEDEALDYEVIEVVDRAERLEGWRTPEDHTADLPTLPLDEGELWPADALEDVEPDEDAYYEATGNEGASFERTYRRAALVLWPSAWTLEVLLAAGAAGALPFLEEQVDAGKGAQALLADIQRVLAEWPRDTYRDKVKDRLRMISLLVRLRANELLEPFVRDTLAMPLEPALADVMRALWRQPDAALCERIAREATDRLDPDEVLVPAALALASEAQGQPGWETLRGATVAHLQERASQPLAPPADQARTTSWACTCAHCRSLRAFLADPVEKSWSLKAGAPDRSHVEHEVRGAGADLDLSTLKKGSPHTLICTKNQRSYERRVAQCQQDLAALAQLRG